MKMKPTDVNSSTYIDFGGDNNDKSPKSNVCDHARISKYKNIFAKGYAPNSSEEVKNTVSWTYIIEDLNGEEIIGMLYEKELQKQT